MKIVIDIPEDDYKEVKEDTSNSGTPFENRVFSAIANGTPLDNIKAEFISQYPKNVYGDLELGGRGCVFSLNKVLEIIDEYRGES